jgi:hypothetical protein
MRTYRIYELTTINKDGSKKIEHLRNVNKKDMKNITSIVTHYYCQFCKKELHTIEEGVTSIENAIELTENGVYHEQNCKELNKGVSEWI